MSALFLLIAVSLTVAVLFLVAFLWSVRDGQYDDDYTPSVRILFDSQQGQRGTNELNFAANKTETPLNSPNIKSSTNISTNKTTKID